MAQTSMTQYDGGDWKAKLKIPAKDTRVQTAVRGSSFEAESIQQAEASSALHLRATSHDFLFLKSSAYAQSPSLKLYLQLSLSENGRVFSSELLQLS